jgi:Ca2+-binding EF-hand superfamily protein
VSLASDLNEDGSVDFADLAALGSVWGKKSGEEGFHPDFDLDGDGTIWIGDLVILLQSYGVAH